MPTDCRCQFLAHSDPDAAHVHQGLRDDPEVLGRLQFQGIQAGIGKYYQLRGCPGCGSTVNVEVTARRALELLAVQAGLLARTLDQIVDALTPSRRRRP